MPKMAFDLVIAPLNYGWEVVEWARMFSRKKIEISFWPLGGAVFVFETVFGCKILAQAASNELIGLKWSFWVARYLVKSWIWNHLLSLVICLDLFQTKPGKLYVDAFITVQILIHSIKSDHEIIAMV